MPCVAGVHDAPILKKSPAFQRVAGSISRCIVLFFADLYSETAT
jgi:hypothetical protein